MTTCRSFLPRRDACCICGASVLSKSATTTDPEAPEMLQLPAGAWTGIVRDEPSGEVRIIMCCSNECLFTLLREEP